MSLNILQSNAVLVDVALMRGNPKPNVGHLDHLAADTLLFERCSAVGCESHTLPSRQDTNWRSISKS